MADNDLLTLSEAKDAINQSGATHDSELQMWITAVSNRIDELCGYVVKRTVADETHNGGRRIIQLNHAPASLTATTTIQTVTEYSNTTEHTLLEETNTDKPAHAYLFDVKSGILRRRSGGADATFATGRANVVVNYEPGRYETTAAVGDHFKLTAGAIMRRLWQRESGAWAVGGDPFTDQGTVGFFRAMSESMINEFLHDELRLPVVA